MVKIPPSCASTSEAWCGGALQCLAKCQEKHSSPSLVQVFEEKEKVKALVSSGDADKNGKVHLSFHRKHLMEQKDRGKSRSRIALMDQFLSIVHSLQLESWHRSNMLIHKMEETNQGSS